MEAQHPPLTWIEQVRATKTGAELSKFLVARLARPYEEGPAPDDRNGEGPEEIFENLTREDVGFRLRLEDAIADYFKNDDAGPASREARRVMRGALELVQRLGLTGTFTPLQFWLEKHQDALKADPNAVLGRAVMGALAMAQPREHKELRDFWMKWWREAPPAWIPRVFIGLRLHDPAAAAEEIPRLMLARRSRGRIQGRC